MAESDDEFFDCPADDGVAMHVTKVQSSNGSAKPAFQRNHILASTSSSIGGLSTADDITSNVDVWDGRSMLPCTSHSRSNFSVWSFLKQCIGKELSKITMPVIFNEPLSFLQRVVEYMEYEPLIERASRSDDPIERHELITAFAVSATASNWDRIGKPFNPLLGETYELDRPDLGIRVVCEQVSHHPPVSAFHMESDIFIFHGAVHPKLKFWGKSVEVTPKGVITLYLKRHKEAYSWQNVNCCVHNIIVGKLWIEHYGAMEVMNHMTMNKAILNFRPCGWFGRDLHKIEGFLLDNNKRKLRAFYGKWVEALYSYDVDVWEEYLKACAGAGVGNPIDSNPRSGSSGKERPISHVDYNTSRPVLSKTQSEPVMAAADADNVPDEVPVKGASCDLNLPSQKRLWLVTHKPDDANRYYSFTRFALLLNELSDEMKTKIAPTDCRFRPDMRKMEEGDIDASGEEKTRIEELQRAARKDRKKQHKPESEPLWFKLGTNPYTGKEDWLFTGEYWKRDWRRCPRIY